jgi:putative ABC transport system ATP-binding protein
MEQTVQIDTALIELRAITKIYQVGLQSIYALKGVDLTIEAGDFLAIAGPSGSGKSTLLNLLALIDTPNSGQIRYDGQDVKELSDNAITQFRNRRVGIVFQSYNLIPVLSATENVAFALQIQGLGRAESTQRAVDMLALVGLDRYAKHRPDELSGGQKQRVAIARALVTKPEIVIADEPTAALDTRTGMGIIDLMKDLNQSLKTTFVFSTHDTRILDSVGQVIQLEDGLIKS